MQEGGALPAHPVPGSWTRPALFGEARNPPGAGTAFGMGGQQPLASTAQGGTGGGELGFMARNPTGAAGTAHLQVQGSKSLLVLERLHFLPKMLAEKRGEAAGQEGCSFPLASRNSLSARPHTSASDLSFFLVMPVQRVTKYPLLLGKILENTPAGTNAHQALAATVSTMAQVNANINEYKRQREVGEWGHG